MVYCSLCAVLALVLTSYLAFASAAAPFSAAAVATAAAVAAVDTDCLVDCAYIEYSSATNVMFIVQVNYQVLCDNILRRCQLSLLQQKKAAARNVSGLSSRRSSGKISQHTLLGPEGVLMLV